MMGNEGPAQGSAHILIVEDNALNMELARDLLKAYGFRVSEACNGKECMSCLERETPNLILMDLQLPDMDGFTLVRQLRSQPVVQALPIVALTAYAMKGDRERAMEAGCTGVITKPIDTRAFPKQVEAYLQGFSERGQDT